jgi:nicotinate-nucleotide pyrophosphorylase (carboxylating)
MIRQNTLIDPQEPDFDETARRNALALLEWAFIEDFDGSGDVTSEAVIPEHATATARYVVRSEGVVAGMPVLRLVAQRFCLERGLRLLARDGDHVTPGAVLAEVSGSMQKMLGMERTALNFLQRLCGIATLTSRFVAEVAGTRAVILDTRKTTPGWRPLEKYAVRCGGGMNHRLGLYDMVLIKDNHLAWLASRGERDPIRAAVSAARSRVRARTEIEIEVDSLDQLDRALRCRPDIILVDNLGPESLSEAVRRRDAKAPGVRLEASGGVTLATAAALARTGIDRISVGALTHSAPALDIGLDFVGGPPP